MTIVNSTLLSQSTSFSEHISVDVFISNFFLHSSMKNFSERKIIDYILWAFNGRAYGINKVKKLDTKPLISPILNQSSPFLVEFFDWIYHFTGMNLVSSVWDLLVKSYFIHPCSEFSLNNNFTCHFCYLAWKRESFIKLFA